jgi:nitrile hydratase
MSHDTHSHDHQPPPGSEGPLTYYQTMETAVRELLIDKGVITADEVRAAIEAMDARSPAQGARVVARAWSDPAYKARLLADGTAACQELGIDMGPTHLVVVADDETTHNVIVCTLCSCYPRMLLGLPPDWYKARAYRSRVVREPRAVLAEFGTRLPHGAAPPARRHPGDGRSRARRAGDPRLPDRRHPAEDAVQRGLSRPLGRPWVEAANYFEVQTRNQHKV